MLQVLRKHWKGVALTVGTLSIALGAQLRWITAGLLVHGRPLFPSGFDPPDYPSTPALTGVDAIGPLVWLPVLLGVAGIALSRRHTASASSFAKVGGLLVVLFHAATIRSLERIVILNNDPAGKIEVLLLDQHASFGLGVPISGIGALVLFLTAAALRTSWLDRRMPRGASPVPARPEPRHPDARTAH